MKYIMNYTDTSNPYLGLQTFLGYLSILYLFPLFIAQHLRSQEQQHNYFLLNHALHEP